MNRFTPCLFLLGALTWASPAVAESDDHSVLHVAHSWARASIGQNPNSAAYVTIHNPTESKDRVVSIDCEAATRCEIHNHIMEDGIMKMRRVESLVLDEGAHLEFAPGGLHIMMFDLKAPLVEGEETLITFTFESAGAFTTKAKVLSLRDAAERGKKSMHEKHMSEQEKHNH